jgi:hypothetical protein
MLDYAVRSQRCTFVRMLTAFLIASALAQGGNAPDWALEIRQLTFGPKHHHFFGYIGHVGTVPWNASGRYIAMLRTTFQDHMPAPSEAAEIVLLDTSKGNAIQPIDRSHAWNIQQGTMMYWDPQVAETRLFFNDRDRATGKIFTVLYDVARRKRVREFRFDDTPVGNSGVSQKGGRFLGLNYGRLARLRPVTGYPGAFDWTEGEKAPANDGIFLIDVQTGKKRLLVSFQQLARLLEPQRPDIREIPLFINHTLWNREDDLIYFYVRGNFGQGPKQLNVPCTVRPDGAGLTAHELYGGHPEWAPGRRIVGDAGGRQILYDPLKKSIVGHIGTPEILPRPGGDAAISPDGAWFVNGYRIAGDNFYTVLRLGDGTWQRTRGFPTGKWNAGDVRLDPAPAWSRDGARILFPAIAEDGTRQSFLITIVPKR